MGKLGLNSGYIGSDQRTTANGVVGYDKYFLERKNGRFQPILEFTGLLSTYSGAAAAYSVRLLDNAYTGFCMRIRRASDNAEQDIGFSGIGELNVSAITSFCGASDGFVVTWYDQSGNSYNQNQNTSTYQPKIHDATTGIVYENSRPALQTFGNQFMRASSANPITNTTYTFFAVYQVSDTNSTRYFAGLPASSLHLGWRNAQSSTTVAHHSDDENYSISGAPYTSQALALHTPIFRSPGSAYYLNGTLLGTSTTTPAGDITSTTALQIMVGYSSSGKYNGKTSEIIVYSSDKTSSVLDISENINNYYSIY